MHCLCNAWLFLWDVRRAYIGNTGEGSNAISSESEKEKQVVRVLQSLNRSVLYWRLSYSYELVVIRACSPAGKLYSETEGMRLIVG